jgi:hypothetical protein
VLNCPKWFKSDECDQLMDFAKGCTKYPIEEKCDAGEKGGNKKKGKDGKGKMKKEEEDDDDNDSEEEVEEKDEE